MYVCMYVCMYRNMFTYLHISFLVYFKSWYKRICTFHLGFFLLVFFWDIILDTVRRILEYWILNLYGGNSRVEK